MKKLFIVDFKPVYPVGGGLVILADDEAEARKIASETITHIENLFESDEFSVTEYPTPNESGVVLYLSGEY